MRIFYGSAGDESHETHTNANRQGNLLCYLPEYPARSEGATIDQFCLCMLDLSGGSVDAPDIDCHVRRALGRLQLLAYQWSSGMPSCLLS
jgi:hypothetical protein